MARGYGWDLGVVSCSLGSLAFVGSQCAPRHPEFLNGLGTGCLRLQVPLTRAPSVGVEWPVTTVSEPWFLIMFPPGVPTLGGGSAVCVCQPSPCPARGGGVSPVCFSEHFQEKRTRGHLHAPFLSVRVLPLCASCQAVHLAWPGVTHRHPALFPI